MQDYMNEHNYGREDADVYQNDPEWQRLNQDLQEEDHQKEEFGEAGTGEVKENDENVKKEAAAAPGGPPNGPDPSAGAGGTPPTGPAPSADAGGPLTPSNETADISPEDDRTALERMRDYMYDHNYGREDGEIYKKDPEWQKLNEDLMREDGLLDDTDEDSSDAGAGSEGTGDVMPGNETGEDMAPDEAVSQILQTEERDTRPVSQILQTQEQDTHPVNQILQTAEVAELNEGCFDAVPEYRREAVLDRFSEAPPEVKEIINENAENLQVDHTEGDDCCHYNLDTKKICMEEIMDNDEYSEVFSHEYGHFVDDMKGGFSSSDEFRNAILQDVKQYDDGTADGRARMDAMLKEAFDSGAAYDRMISDNFSAAFKNSATVMEGYQNRGISYYGHYNDYWELTGKREAELYANSFSIYASNTRESKAFMERYFPNVWGAMKKSLQRR